MLSLYSCLLQLLSSDVSQLVGRVGAPSAPLGDFGAQFLSAKSSVLQLNADLGGEGALMSITGQALMHASCSVTLVSRGDDDEIEGAAVMTRTQFAVSTLHLCLQSGLVIVVLLTYAFAFNTAPRPRNTGEHPRGAIGEEVRGIRGSSVHL